MDMFKQIGPGGRCTCFVALSILSCCEVISFFSLLMSDCLCSSLSRSTCSSCSRLSKVLFMSWKWRVVHEKTHTSRQKQRVLEMHTYKGIHVRLISHNDSFKEMLSEISLTSALTDTKLNTVTQYWREKWQMSEYRNGETTI